MKIHKKFRIALVMTLSLFIVSLVLMTSLMAE
jgi:hypothetical protein